MENRQLTKSIQIKNRKFILRKYDPMFGCYLAMQLFGSVLGGDNRDDNKLEDLVKNLIAKSPEESKKLQSSILKYVDESLPAGNTPVINEDGNISIIGLTAPMTLQLFIQSVIFNISDFFDQEVIEGILGQMKDLAPENPLPHSK